jgi:hypothetical protein
MHFGVPTDVENRHTRRGEQSDHGHSRICDGTKSLLLIVSENLIAFGYEGSLFFHGTILPDKWPDIWRSGGVFIVSAHLTINNVSSFYFEDSWRDFNTSVRVDRWR